MTMICFFRKKQKLEICPKKFFETKVYYKVFQSVKISKSEVKVNEENNETSFSRIFFKC